MPNGLSRDEVDALIVRIRLLLVEQEAGTMQTERARHEVEQIVADAAGQLGDVDRRAVALFAEQIIASVWSGDLSLGDACSRVENVVSAAADNNPAFIELLRAP